MYFDKLDSTPKPIWFGVAGGHAEIFSALLTQVLHAPLPYPDIPNVLEHSPFVLYKMNVKKKIKSAFNTQLRSIAIAFEFTITYGVSFKCPLEDVTTHPFYSCFLNTNMTR